MEWESDSPCCSHTHLGEGHRSPGRCSSWELECRDCSTIPGQGLLMTAERQTEGMRRRLWWEIPVEESWGAVEARWHCWVMRREWNHYHSLSLPTHQHPQLNNREAGSSNTWCTELQSRTLASVPLYVPDTPNNREGLQAREPSKWLNRRSYWERLSKEASDRQLQEVQKKTDKAITLGV